MKLEDKMDLARKIFNMRGLTSNISDALVAYLLILDEDFDEDKLREICEVKFCPRCGTTLRLRNLEDGESNAYSSAWRCPECEYEKFNKLGKETIIDQRNRLKEYCRYINESPKSGFPFCEQCGRRMAFKLLPPKGDNNKYGYETHWYCPNQCTEFFSHKSPNELIKERKDGLSKVS